MKWFHFSFQVITSEDRLLEFFMMQKSHRNIKGFKGVLYEVLRDEYYSCCGEEYLKNDMLILLFL